METELGNRAEDGLGAALPNTGRPVLGGDGEVSVNHTDCDRQSLRQLPQGRGELKWYHGRRLVFNYGRRFIQ